MGSNGTVDERLAEAEAARAVLGAALARQPAAARSRARHEPRPRAGGRRPRPARARRGRWRCRTGAIVIPITWRRASCSPTPCSTPACGAIDAEGEAWKPDWICYYFINDSRARRRSWSTSASTYETKRRALACHVTQFAPRAADAVATRLTSSRFQQLIESRDAQFGALAGVAFAEGFVVKQPVVRPHLPPTV